MWYRQFGKRTFDVFIASIGLLVASPIIVLTASVLFFTGKVFFVQQRPGKGGRPFTILKFRTMSEERDGAGTLLSDDQRITKVGSLIRQFSLDELLQLVNVLRGDMSIVGPRPLLMEYLPRYSAEQARRHDVRPGITGLAQVEGRNSISWQDKFRWDVYYVDNFSFLLDLKILFKTLLVVLQRKGIGAGESRSTPPFLGNA